MSIANVCINCYLMEYFAAKNSKMYYKNNGVLRHTSKRRNLLLLTE